MLDACIHVISDEDIGGFEENTVGHSRSDAVIWMLSFIGKNFMDKFQLVMAELGFPVGEKMTPEELQAMMSEGNTGVRAMRVIRHHLAAKSATKRQHLFPSEDLHRSLGKSDPALPIDRETIDDKGNKVPCWCKKLDKVLSKQLPSCYKESWCSLKFTLGADHGAGAEQIG